MYQTDKSKAKTGKRNPGRPERPGVVMLCRDDKIRAGDLWRGDSGQIHPVAEWEVGKTVGFLYDTDDVAERYCIYLRPKRIKLTHSRGRQWWSERKI
jgi:hypothetical protein